MWSKLLFLSLFFCINADIDTDTQSCISDDDLVSVFRPIYDDYSMQLLLASTAGVSSNKVLSPLAAYICLMEILEGTNQEAKDELYSLLQFPSDDCSRQKFIQFAKSRIYPSENFNYTMRFFVDENVTINSNVTLEQVTSLPIKTDPQSALDTMRTTLSLANEKILDLSGNLVPGYMLNFSNQRIDQTNNCERSAFYNQSGSKIGYDIYMKTTLNVRIAGPVSIFSTVIEIPVGKNSNYQPNNGNNDQDNRMLIGKIADQSSSQEVVSMDNKTLSSILEALQEAVVADVYLPCFEVTSETDMKAILQNKNITSIWNNSEATSGISTPAAEISSFVERVIFNINAIEVNEQSSDQTGDRVQFVANQPFVFALYDAATYTNIIVGQYLVPSEQ